MPIFFIALVSMYIFAVNFKAWGLPYLPTVGMFEPEVGKTPAQVAVHMILPVLSLALISMAAYSRYIRSTMLEVMNQDYIRTARSKGLRRRYIIWVHALKNASLPIVTLVGLDLPLLLGGAVVTERIFAWPGMGRLFLDKVERGDTPVVMGILMMIAVAVIVFQIIADIVYAWLDPRIRLTLRSAKGDAMSTAIESRPIPRRSADEIEAPPLSLRQLDLAALPPAQDGDVRQHHAHRTDSVVAGRRPVLHGEVRQLQRHVAAPGRRPPASIPSAPTRSGAISWPAPSMAARSRC